MPPHKTVSLNSAGHPVIRVKVWGISDQFAQEFEALVDTGFTGFLMLPLMAAIPLGLTLMATTSYSLADGSTTNTLLALGTIDYEGQQIFGPISLEQNSSCRDVLVGMEFIKQGKLMLMLHAEGAALIDLETIRAALAGMEQLQSTASEQPQPPQQPPLPDPSPEKSN